jgi:hypothetical protein
MGKFLFVGAVMLMVGFIANAFFQIAALYIALRSSRSRDPRPSCLRHQPDHHWRRDELRDRDARDLPDVGNVFANLLALLGIAAAATKV